MEKTTLKQKVTEWFSDMDWKQYFVNLLWRIIGLPVIFIIFLLLIVIGSAFCLSSWLFTGESYSFEIEVFGEKLLTKIWRKTFPDGLF